MSSSRLSPRSKLATATGDQPSSAETRPDAPGLLSIAAVERDTGLLKDTLRVWEKRYGFPQPLRDANGERIYPREQVERLRQIRRLMDQGHRPGKLFAASPTDFAALLVQRDAPAALPAEVQRMLGLLQASAADTLRSALQERLQALGLEDFVLHFATPLSIAIGAAWARGELEVAHEHLYTEQMQNLLRAALTALPIRTGSPRVLLTTFPNELHSLGLLFAQALLASHGAACTSLGAQTPLEDIRKTAQNGGFDVILLSFSGAFPARAAFSGLRTLAADLAPGTQIWAGGRHLADKPAAIDGVRYLAGMADTLLALHDWHATSPS
ncbi:MerR family transcriptional regulator [Uliginosibacterium sp. 31-12]|uniref:MerR family transcriptional regulator n=1 Tax=Uliginosibacterium sp. 31-12 TaxID=3062781 RepID=UPI0026E19F33|nr:MerR family transcriptional regulator [Uliginosibacterium sp. 31-12]MDO6387445.1 MerR family transcriptional regulator [Uliginosibacterium sp. 31-12]